MKCPKCSGKGTDDRHLKNLGGKRKYAEFDTRRYKCQRCGFRFLTVEKFLRPVKAQSSEE